MRSGDVSPGAFLKRRTVVIGIEGRGLLKMLQRLRRIAGKQRESSNTDFVRSLRSRATVDRSYEYTTSDECSGANRKAPLQARSVDLTGLAPSLT